MWCMWLLYTFFKPYTIAQIYVRASKSCKIVEISTITTGVKLQNLTKKCHWNQKVPLILIMGTFFKKVWGYFTENKIPFLPFSAYAITFPIPFTFAPFPLHLHYTTHHIIVPSPTSSFTYPLPLPTTLHFYPAPLPHPSLISTYQHTLKPYL